MRVTHRSIAGMVAALSLSFVAGSTAHAQLPSHRLIETLYPLPPEYEPGGAVPPLSIGFGTAVAIRDETAMVSMPARVGGSAVAVYQRSSSGAWTRTATLRPKDGGDMGSAIALRGDTAVIGGRAAAYVFKRRNGLWVQTEKLTPPSSDGVTDFARSLDYQDRTVVIGAARAGASGAVYVYRLTYAGRRAGMARLLALDGHADDGFGADVSMTFNSIVVGAPQAEAGGAGVSTGAAYVFRSSSSGWRQTQKLIAVDGEGGDQFGTAVEIDNGMILVGAPRADAYDGRTSPPFDDAVGGGVVYGFLPAGGLFVEQFRLRPRRDQATDHARFGNDIAMFGDRVAIGAEEPDPLVSINPGALVFTATRAGSTVSLLGVVHGGYTGSRIALANNWLLIGSRLDDVRCYSSCIGQGFIYDINYVLR